MNFLTFRDQIYDWTLDTDENLFNQVNQLTDYIFQTQQNITQSIAITRHALNDSSTILNNNFNHYLRLSQNKFTENKIAEPKKFIDENAKNQDTPTEPKSKMDIFKQALNISLKNLQIKEQEKQADSVSISELSLSQAIFKNARLPPYFGSKQFRAQKFLNLFFDEDMGSQIQSKKEIENMSNKPLSTPSQDNSSTSLGSSNTNVSSGYLPPPPSLQTLNLANNMTQTMSGTLPPPPIPPPLNLLPPPPLPPGLLPPPPLGLPNLPAPPSLRSLPQARQSVVIDDQDENKQLLESILVATRSMNNNSDGSEGSNQPQFQQSSPLTQPPKPVDNKPLTFQQELALKLKLGKDYKPPARVIQTSKPQPKQEPKKQPESSFEKSNSFRQSAKIQDIIGVTQKPAIKRTSSAVVDQEEEEEQNALFGSGKRKTISQIQTQSSKFGMSKNQADAMMSRSTFNQDMLFKKKPIFSKETLLSTKPQQKPKQKQQKKPNRASVLFNQDSDEDQDFTFKKKTTKKPEEKKPQQQQSPKKKSQQKKSNPLGFTQKLQLKEKPVQQPKKKQINKLFGGESDQEGDIIPKKKPSKKQAQTSSKPTEAQAPKIIQKPAQKAQQKPSNPLAQAKTQKKNSLFNDDEQEDEFTFKPKPKPPVKKESKKQEKKSSPFGEDELDDSAFKPKPKPVNKQIEPEPIQQEVQKPKPQSPQKFKAPLFSSIPQAQNEEGSGIFLPKKSVDPEPQPIQKIEQASEDVQEQESEEVIRMKKIARMGGQPMMGMAQMIPKGMNITKPSETKQNQKIAREHIEQEKVKRAYSEVVVNVQPKRQLDPLEKLITQTIKPQQPVVKVSKTEPIEPKRELDPLEKLISITVAKKAQQNPNPIFETQTKSIPKPELSKVEQQPEIQPNNAPQVTLQVRRKKNKPKRNDEDFDDDQKEKQVKKPVAQIKSKTQVKQTKIDSQQKLSPAKQVKKNPLAFSKAQQNSEKASQIDKIAKMSMAGMPQMGMGSLLMPKGLIITKPSQAKKLEQQALEKMIQEEEERAIRQEQDQKERERQRQIKEIQEQQQIRRAQQQEQLKLQNLANQKLREEQEQRERRDKQIRQQQQRQQQQRLLYEQQQKQRAAYEQALRQQQAYEESLRQQQQQFQAQRQQQQLQRQRQQQQLQRQRQQQQAQELQRRRIQQEKQRLRKAQQDELKKQKSSLPSLTAFEPVPKKQSNPLGGKAKQSGPLDVPKMPPKLNPLGGTSAKSPLSATLGGPLGVQKSTGLLSANPVSVPPMPAINRDPLKNTGKKSLFDDDEDQGFSKKKQTNLPKQSLTNNSDKKKPSLFGDDDDDSGFGFGSKPKPKKNTTEKKGLFQDDDDQGFGFGKKNKKPQPKQPIIQPPVIQAKPEPKPIAQKPTLLKNDSDDDGGTFGKKKPQVKEPIKPALMPQKSSEEIKAPQPTIAQKPNNKKRLFGGSDSDSDEGFGKKKVTKQSVQAPTPTTNNLIQNQSKPVTKAQKDVKSKKGLFDSSDDEEEAQKPTKPTVVNQTSSAVVAKATQGKKNLFGGSDDQDDVFKRKPQKKPEPVKNLNSSMQNEPLIPSKKAQMPATSPLSGGKGSNPLGLSSGQIQSKPALLLQPPTTQSSQAQQKKRNLFSQSDQQPSPMKAKPVQQISEKKKLIEEDSEEQKPQVQKLNKNMQPEPQAPPVQSNNNRRLFDDSEDDSDAEEIAKKKRMANSKIQKLF